MRTSCRHRSRAAPAAVLALSFLAVLSPAAPSHAEDLVAYAGSERAGTIVVRTGERRLYFTLGNGKALMRSHIEPLPRKRKTAELSLFCKIGKHILLKH